MQADYTMHTDNACVLLAGKCQSLYMHKSLHNKILYNGMFVLPKQVLILLALKTLPGLLFIVQIALPPKVTMYAKYTAIQLRHSKTLFCMRCRQPGLLARLLARLHEVLLWLLVVQLHHNSSAIYFNSIHAIKCITSSSYTTYQLIPYIPKIVLGIVCTKTN